MPDQVELRVQLDGNTPILDRFDEFRFGTDRVGLIERRSGRTTESENVEHVQRMVLAEKIDILYPYATGTAKVVDQNDGDGVRRRVQASHCPYEVVTASKEKRIRTTSIPNIPFFPESLPNMYVFTVVFVF